MIAVLAELRRAVGALETGLAGHGPRLEIRETGRVLRAGEGIALVDGLPGVRLEELVEVGGGGLGIAFDLRPHEVGVVLLDPADGLEAGQEVRRTGRVLDVPVGEALLGRVVDAVGRPLDERGPIRAAGRRPIEREAAAIIERAPVEVPLATGIKVVDALLPIGRGQRELIVGDRQTGKTAIALDAVLNQRGRGVPCVYCAVGQRSSAVARLVAELERRRALAHTVVVVAGGDDPPGLQYAAPYAATTIAEYFMEQGRDVLVVYDDLTRHARSYRELSLLLRRPPGREAYPGDVFHIHARLLERATHLRAGGSMTALPIVETQAQNLAAYIPTNLISITDGQIVLSPDLFSKGILPAVDVGRSVSRVGARAQLPAYREVAGRLRLAYAQFEELEEFARFETRFDEETRRILEHGRRIREVLGQPEGEPLPVAEQIAVLLAATEGLFDGLPLGEVGEAAGAVASAAAGLPAAVRAIEAGETLSAELRAELLAAARRGLEAR